MKTKEISREQIEKEVEEMKLKEMTIDSLQAAAPELEAMAGKIVELIPSIEFDDESMGARDVMTLVAPLGEFFQFWKSVEILFALDFDAMRVDAKQSVNDLNNRMASLLDDVLKALEGRDHVTVTDLLEYEIAPGIRQYAKIIPSLIEVVRSKKVA